VFPNKDEGINNTINEFKLVNKKLGEGGIFGDIHEVLYQDNFYAVKFWPFSFMRRKEKDLSADPLFDMLKNHTN
jgi:hypothetical protein